VVGTRTGHNSDSELLNEGFVPPCDLDQTQPISDLTPNVTRNVTRNVTALPFLTLPTAESSCTKHGDEVQNGYRGASPIAGKESTMKSHTFKRVVLVASAVGAYSTGRKIWKGQKVSSVEWISAAAFIVSLMTGE
jgi:hypothetical protein